MADKDFKVKNKLYVNGLSNTSGVILATNNNLDSHTNVPTQYGGTGTTTSPTSGQVLYSESGSTYAPTTLANLVTGSKYQADAPSSPTVGQIWIESDSSSDSFDPNIIRRHAFTATAGQTNFVASVSFIDGYEQVYFNGLLLLKNSDYTTSGGNTVVLTTAAAENDIVEIITVTNLNSTNTYTQAEIDSALSAKLSTSTAASTYLTQSNATSTYLTQSNASSTYAAKSNPTFTAIGGDEGGQINLGTAATNTTLSGPISLDIYQNRLRVFEGGGNNRGAYVDLSTLSNGVGSELIAAAPQSGNSGKYLTTNGTVASWTTPTSGSLVKINSTTLNSASTVTISNIFTSTYDNYMITWSQSGASANYGGIWQLTVNGTATNTNYYSVAMTANSSNTYAVSSWAVIANPFYNDSFAPWYYTNGTSTPADSPAAVTYVFNPNKARTTTMITTGWGNNGVYNLHGAQSSNTQFDGFKWTPNGPTVSGTITVYGIEK